MDSGEVIPGLNEGWSFIGATLIEWMSGFLICMLLSSAFHLHPSRSAPLVFIILFGTVFGMAALRKKFPDEHKGVASLLLVRLGVKPPHIPAPAELQPFWSGAPVRELEETKDYMYLDLDDMFEDMNKEREGKN